MLNWVAQVGRLRTVRQFGASCLQKVFERKWENRLLLIMLIIFSVLSRSANLEKWHGDEKSLGRTRYRNKDPVGQSIRCESYWKKKNFSPSIPLRCLSLDIYRANAISSKQLRTSHVTGKNDDASVPFARQILAVVIITTDEIVHVYITEHGWCTHTTVNRTEPILQPLLSRPFPNPFSC